MVQLCVNDKLEMLVTRYLSLTIKLTNEYELDFVSFSAANFQFEIHVLSTLTISHSSQLCQNEDDDEQKVHSNAYHY